jgi:hypothetical protein
MKPNAVSCQVGNKTLSLYLRNKFNSVQRGIVFIAAIFGVLTAWAAENAEAPNLLKNGSFMQGLNEKGAPKFWRIEKSRGVEGKVELLKKTENGEVTAHIVKSNTNGAIYLTQNVRLKNNTDYILEVKGRRKAAYRWHYYGVRMPDTKIRAAGKIPVKGGKCPPIKFTSDSKRTLCYVNIGLWGYNKGNKATIGEMWIDEVSLRELPRRSGYFKGLADTYFQNDTLRGTLFSTDFKGLATLIIKNSKDKIIARKDLKLVTGKNAFELKFANAPVGNARLIVQSKDGKFKIEYSFLVQKGF